MVTTREPQNAPGALALVQEFVNTADVESAIERLPTATALAEWLRRHGLLDDDASPAAAELERGLKVREALRTLLLANNGVPVEPGATTVLDDAAARGRLNIRFDADGTASLEPRAPGIDGALARLLAIVHASTLDGTWPRLKACRNHGCWWAFYDASKNRSRTWCSMAVCGSRVKARNYRARRRQG